MKEQLRVIVKKYLDCGYRIKIKEAPREIVEKKLFVDTVKLLREIEDRTEFMVGEIGLDPTEYENTFFAVIENLLALHFDKAQLALIQYYIYQLPHVQDFDGVIEITRGKKTEEVEFTTPEHLWDALQKVS